MNEGKVPAGWERVEKLLAKEIVTDGSDLFNQPSWRKGLHYVMESQMLSVSFISFIPVCNLEIT